MNRRDILYIVVIAGLLGALLAPMVAAQVGGEWAITEQSDSRIVLERESAPEPTSTATIEPTATEVPPTATAEPVDNAWHPPTDHEHGDAPPAVVEQWSIDTFGHGVIYGGDEGTPNENEYKHKGFGGYILEDDGATMYIRTHMMTTPLGRSGPCHSYEVYQVVGGAVVGFWQGWISYTADASCDPAEQNLVIQCADSGLRPIIKAAQASCGNPPPFENWYANNIPTSWDIGINSQQTTFADGDPDDSSTWILTGDNEPTRRIEAAFYVDRWEAYMTEVWIDSGQAIDVWYDEWYCADVLGFDIQESSTPDAPGGCAAGYLDQWVSSDVVSVTFPGNSVQTTFFCPSCQFPNH